MLLKQRHKHIHWTEDENDDALVNKCRYQAIVFVSRIKKFHRLSLKQSSKTNRSKISLSPANRLFCGRFMLLQTLNQSEDGSGGFFFNEWINFKSYMNVNYFCALLFYL